MIKKILLIIQSILFILIVSDTTFINLILPKNLFCLLSIFICILLTENIHNLIIFIMTFFADYNLIFTQKYVSGLYFFIIAQALRTLYFSNKHSSKVIIFVSIIITILLSFMINKLIAAAIGYSILLIANTILSLKNNNIKDKIGMILFILCDICVALNYLISYKTIFAKLVWIFYIPSATLLSFSNKKKKYI